MVNLKGIAGKYDLTPKDLELCYYNTLHKVRRLAGRNCGPDLIKKYMEDSLEEMAFCSRDVAIVSDYYAYDFEKEKAEQEEIQEDESIQTSTNTGIDKAIGRNRKPNPDFHVKTIYGK